MQQHQKSFKRPPRRFQPKGLSVLYEDHDIVVVDKAGGLLTVSTDRGDRNTAYYLLTDYVRKGNPKSGKRVFIVHRLDRDASGVLVFAKHVQAKQHLQGEWSQFEKRYNAIVVGRPPKEADVITSYLAENRAHRVYSVTNRKHGKLARTGYRVVSTSKRYSLLEIDLFTGRKNQIRVHLSELGCPVVGDRKYGTTVKGTKRLALHAATLTITHPHSREPMTFTAPTPSWFAALVNRP